MAGDLGFSSGDVKRRGTFTFSFNRAGIFHVSSAGCSKHTGVINVLDTGNYQTIETVYKIKTNLFLVDARATVPFLLGEKRAEDENVVKVGHVIELAIEAGLESDIILYTLDGRRPSLKNGVKVIEVFYRKILLFSICWFENFERFSFYCVCFSVSTP